MAHGFSAIPLTDMFQIDTTGRGKILVLDLQQNSGKTTEYVLKLILLLIKSGFVERKCVILLLCCVIW